MNVPAGCVFRRVRDAEIASIVRIHSDVLGYTLNSWLGVNHLTLLYHTMCQDPGSYVGVALVNDIAAGVVSGTVDSGRLRSAVLRQLPLAGLARIGLRMLLHPRRILDWGRSVVVAAPLEFQSARVEAELTAIGVDNAFRDRGIGRGLIAALEAFFRGAGTRQYRLDTRIENEGAAEFYRNLGFHEIGRRADSILFVRTLD